MYDVYAAEFAGVQCQIQFGDYHEEKHKPGFIENFSEYLPEQYCSSWGIEKKILKEYSTHGGLNELEAKHLYTKTARALPTYGVTFFLVKEKQKGKKKMVPRLLGINAEAILRLDETSKEIIQTWPLTHVKTYHAGKGETFTLNFGDYTDKEYSVKTRDAFRIRDILEGYIDLIRKRMLAHYNVSSTDYGYVGQENITSGQASMMTHIANNPSKIVEHSFVGPSKIVEYAPGQVASQGTQMVTAQQLIINEMKNKQGQGVLKAEVGMRQDMGIPFTRRLNRLNSNSVKIVTLLTEPSQAHIEDSQKIVEAMKADMPSVKEGVTATIAKQTSDEERKKLQDQLDELDELMRMLQGSTNPDSINAAEAEEAAKRIATLSTEMYFAIAPETRRRSRILSKTRTSFIADDKTEKQLRRASFIAASATANHALDSAAELAEEEYKGPPLTSQQVEELKRAAVDKIGKINAAIAHYMLAHSDPHNIDYATAVTSLNTIHELMPDLARDAQALDSVKDGKDRSQLINDVKELCAAAKYLCSLSGVDDADKLQVASAKYADVSGRLVYVFGKRGAKQRADKENQILELADAVVDKTSALLKSTQGLTAQAAAEPAAADVNEAGAKTAAAAKSLHAQAGLNAPTIHEPHCQSALTAASEALSSSAQHLAASWKPLVEHPSRHVLGEKLHNQTMDLAKALDQLTEAYGSGDKTTQDVKSAKPGDETQRLQFINSLSKVGGSWKAAEDDLNKHVLSPVSAAESAAAQQRLAARLAQLNAALAALLAATSDRSNPDYGTADAAITTINELMPELVKDSKIASANHNAASKAELLDDIKALCAATNKVCASAYGADPEGLNDALAQYTASSGKLTYVCNRRANPDRESQIIDATSSACAQAGALLSGVQQLCEVEGGAVGGTLDSQGVTLADAAQTLLTTAQMTAASISDPRCQSTLYSSIDKVSSAGKALEDTWIPLKTDPKFETRVLALNAARRQLEKQLDKLRAACQIPDREVEAIQESQTLLGIAEGQSIEQRGWQKESAVDGQQPQKLQFIAAMKVAKDKLADAEKELNKPTMPAKGSDMTAVKRRLTEGLEQLNAAVAGLLAATADRENPDGETAGQAADNISKLMPQLIRDSKTVSATMDEPARAAMLAEIKALCDATQGVCASSYGQDSTQQNLNDAVAKFAEASGKLVFVVNPRKTAQKKDEIVRLAGVACGETSSLLSGVQKLAGSAGGARGEALDEKGARLSTAAQNMMQSAQILSPSLGSRQCQEALVSSVGQVSSAAQQLEASVSPLQHDARHGPAASDALQALQRLQNKLDTLKTACDACGSQDASQEQQKLQFIKTVEATKEKWADAQRELKKPVTPARGADTGAIESRLSQRLAALDAAVAALLTATADPDKPNYAEAEKSVKTISELLPHIIQESKTVSGTKQEPARAAMLAEITALCDATRAVCASSYGADPQGLNDAVSKFSDASGKLVFVVNPRKNLRKQNAITRLASAACGETSSLLAGVQQLASGAGGARERELDERGARLAAHAQNMMQSAQILSPSLGSRQCQEALVSSVGQVSSAAQQLEASVSPLQHDARHGPTADNTLQALQRLQNKLDELRAACDAADSQEATQEQQKQQFIKAVEATKDKWADVQKELKKPVTPARGADMGAIESRLSQRLAELDAAVAALLAATADPEKPSYAEAEKSVKTISELLPHVIQDSKTVSGTKEEPARGAMLAEITALCDATRAVCASSHGADPQGLNDAVSKFVDASGKLVFVVNPRKNLRKQKEITRLASAACGETSSLLAGVQQLASGAGGARERELDERGARLAAHAQNMMQAAQILSPSLPSRECQEALVSSVGQVSSAAQQLEASVSPLQHDARHGPAASDTLQALQRLKNKLDELRAACNAAGSQDASQEQQKLLFIKTVEATKDKWADAQKELKKPVTPARGADTGAIESRLSQRLAALDAAVAALLAATADPDKPCYADAEKSVKTISELLPHIIQDSKTVSGTKEEPARAALLAEVTALCDATRTVCASSHGADPQGLNDAVSKFADASGKLVFVVNPRKNLRKQNEVTRLASAACGETSSLLAGVQQLASGAGGARQRELDERGARLAAHAQNMMQAAQILSPSLPSRECQEALVSSVGQVSSAAQQLEASVSPLQHDARHGPAASNALQALQRLQNKLDVLKAACDATGSQDQEQQKLQFIKTVEATKEKWVDAQKELRKPVTPARGADMGAIESRLSQRLAALDAAVAALLAATADPDKPSYADAEKSVKTISELLPHIIQDSKTVSGTKEEPARGAVLAEITALCDATRAVCASSHSADPQSLNEAVSKFADASGKLVFVVNPRKNVQKQNEIVRLAGAACGETASLLSGVQQLASVGGEKGQALDEHGALLAAQAQHLLQTVQVTAPCISSPACKSALVSSANELSNTAKQLEASVAPLQNNSKHSPAARDALQALQRLENKLDALKTACDVPDVVDFQEEQKIQFIKTVEATQGQWADIQKELKKPVTPARGADMCAIESRLSQRLAALDAAVAALLAATADREKPSYAEAEKSIKTISELLPHIIQDSKTVSASKDEPARAVMLAEVKALCDATQGITASSYGTDTQGLNDAVLKFSEASGKLVYVANPRVNSHKEREVVEGARAACGSAVGLLARVQQLAEEGGGRALDAQGGRVADAAQNLLHTAQITAPSLSSPECRAAFLSSVDSLSQSADQLSRSLAAVGADSKYSGEVRKSNAALKQLQDQLDKLRKTCNAPDSAPPVSKTPPPLPATKPPTIAHASPYNAANVDATQDFLERMRADEGMGQGGAAGPAVVGGVGKVKPAPPARKAPEDEAQRKAFLKSVELADGTIKKHESSLMKQCRSQSGSGPALSHRDMMQKQANLQQHLAQAGLEVANLVAANYADKIDYTAASKSTKALPQLMTSIVEDGTQLSDNLNEMARKAFLYDMLQMCEASRKICDAATSDRQKLNDAAVQFGDTSTKLLYVVSSDVEPALEKEIISRAKAIGDSASRLALDAANVATAASGSACTAAGGNASSVQDICDAGTACVDAAGKLVYTAKLTAPSIHEKPCQHALVTSTDTLSTKLRSFADSWKPLESDPQQAKTISHLSAEASNLERILEELRNDVREGSIGRRRELEQLVVEHTPMRQLTAKILDEAKVHAECATLATPDKIAYAAYADKLTEALRALDLATARCKRTPHDTNKRRDLEAAIQNLQMILLQSRPSRGDKGKTNIVDLMDFMEEVAAEAKSFSSAASGAKVPTAQDKRTLEEIKEKCDNIEHKANQLVRGEVASDLDFNDLFDQFGQECDDVIKQINTEVKGMEDVKAKKLLQSKALALSESCNMLRFATKSGISTEACATLDASLDELDDIEERVIKSVVQEASPGVTLRSKQTLITGHSAATFKLCREVTSSPTGVAPSTVTAYIADVAARADSSNPEENNKLLKHLYKLVHLLKTLTVTSSKRAATWQQVDGPDTARVTEQILQEIYNPESKFGEKSEDKKQTILDQDIAKLLIPSAPKILGDHKQQEVKLTQLASDLSSKCGGLSQDLSPATLGRAARVAADKARELDSIARGTNVTDPVQRRKIDEAAKEMSFCTYNVLKTAESASLDPKNHALRRRLGDALVNLNHSIDKLVWHASSAPVLQRQCGALSRDAAAQLATLQPQPHSAAPFADTCDLIMKQNENISKLKNDQPMPRKEFMRNLDDIGTAVRNSVEGAAQCAYYIAVSETDKDIAKVGVADVPKIQLALESIQDSCMAVISSNQFEQAKEQKEDLHKRILDFSNAMDNAQMVVKNGDVKKTLVKAKSCVTEAAVGLEKGLERQTSMDRVTPHAVSLLEAVNQAHSMVEQCPLVPRVGTMSDSTRDKCDELMKHSKSLLSNTLALINDVNAAPEDPEMMTWVTFSTNRKKLLDAYDALVKSVRRNGHRAGIYDKAPEEEAKEEVRKSYIETQVELANRWLKTPVCKTEAKVIGQQAARNVLDMARQLSEDLKGPEREEVRNVVSEAEELLSECYKKYDHEKSSLLIDRLKELRKCIQRGVVTRVVEDFIEAETPLADLDLLADIEHDETNRKFILERKIASLLAQLGRVTKTARFVANASQQQSIGVELTHCSEQTELLAPMLVKAAQQRIDHPDDKAVIESYKALLAQYAESISKVRDLCDRAVDPMEFVQTAGDTMQRMREDMAQGSNDPQKCAYTSNAISKLANRVIHVSMSSNAVAADPELQSALLAAKQRLHAVTPAANTRASRLPDWRDTTAEILRTTGDVESALGGENIFKKEPTTANLPIYSVARDLHESVREWSSRDNEIVGVARRMAVLMARLSEYMETDKKQALIATSKSIVVESQEVAELAKKLAHECTDVRIKTNLLQTCERIPTISGQLKMLTAVKAASLGQQGVEADKEAMDMLVGNAQSLMLSIQEVVKAAAGASVKIMSQRGPRLRWVRKSYY